MGVCRDWAAKVSVFSVSLYVSFVWCFIELRKLCHPTSVSSCLLSMYIIPHLLIVSVLLKPICPWLDCECDHSVPKNVWLREGSKTHLIHRRFADHVSASPRLHLSWAAIPFDHVHNVMSAVPTAYLLRLYVFMIG